MLTEGEKIEAKLLLLALPPEDVEALTETVSSRMVTAESKEAGIDAILLYSESAKQLLRRKKVKREHIVMYLSEKGQAASHAEDKTSLVKRVLDYWEKHNISNPSNGSVHMDGGLAPDCTIVDDFMTRGKGHKPVPGLGEPGYAEAVNSVDPQQVGLTPDGMAVCNITGGDGQRLAESFAPWYYNMYQQSAAMPPVGMHGYEDLKPTMQWGAHHFWPDAKLQIYELPDGADTRAAGADAVSEKLGNLLYQNGGFRFKPNFSKGGVFGMMTVDNFINISVGGVFYGAGSPYEAGTFEQSFSLKQDLSSNNWRIKTTSLKLMYVSGDEAEAEGEMAFRRLEPMADMPIHRKS